MFVFYHIIALTFRLYVHISLNRRWHNIGSHYLRKSSVDTSSFCTVLLIKTFHFWQQTRNLDKLVDIFITAGQIERCEQNNKRYAIAPAWTMLELCDAMGSSDVFLPQYYINQERFCTLWGGFFSKWHIWSKMQFFTETFFHFVMFYITLMRYYALGEVNYVFIDMIYNIVTPHQLPTKIQLVLIHISGLDGPHIQGEQKWRLC